MHIVTAFLAGLIFSLGLGIAGMTQPAKVIGFLDVAGNWDPSMMFVMGGAIAVNLVLYKWILKRSSPVFEINFSLPTRDKIDVSMLIGAGLFGIGWGMTGYCPGPALTSIVTAMPAVMIFAASMVAGMLLYKQFPSRNNPQ